MLNRFNAMMLCTACLMAATDVLAQQIVVTLNQDSQFVISAPNGPFSVLGLDFHSASGSLSPATDPGPFDGLLSNDTGQLTFLSWQGLTIDGDLTLHGGWSPNGERDVKYYYAQGPQPIGPFILTDADYAYRCDVCLPLDATVDDDANIVIRGIGQTLTSLELHSHSGSLIPSIDPGPFQSVTGSSKKTTYVAPPEGLTVDGELKLNTQWAFGQVGSARDVLLRQTTTQTDPLFARIPEEAYPQRSPIQVTFDDANRFVLNGDGHPISEFRLRSPSGSLLSEGSAGLFASVEATAEEVTYRSQGDPVLLDGQLTLPTSWTIDRFTRRDVSYSYKLADDSQLFANTIPEDNFPDEIDWPMISVSLDDQDRFVLSGEGQPLQDLIIRSFSGSLIPGDDPTPFDRFGHANSGSVFHQGTANVILDGSVTLSTRWNRNEEKDVQIRYGVFNVARDISFDVPRSAFPEVSDPVVPFDGVGGRDNIGIFINEQNQFVLIGNDNRIGELILTSPSDSLIPSDAPEPFAGFDEKNSGRIHLTSEELVSVSGELVLPVRWNPTNGSKDIALGIDTTPLPAWIYPQDRDIDLGDPGSVPGNSAFGGGNGFAFIDETGFISISGDLKVAGLAINSPQGNLVPRPTNDGAPFTFMLSNTEHDVTFGNLGTTVEFNGVWQTGVGYLGSDPTGDLFVHWGDGPESVAIPILDLRPVVPEPATANALLSGVFILVLIAKRRHCRPLAPRT